MVIEQKKREEKRNSDEKMFEWFSKKSYLSFILFLLNCNPSFALT